MKRSITIGGACAALIALSAAGQSADATSFYKVKNLVSDDGATTRKVDPHLINGWGLAAASTTPWWVANNGTDTSTIYRPSGRRLPLVVGVVGAPTGIIANEGSHFVLTKGRRSQPALFMFATEGGTILGWNTLNLMDAVVVIDRSMDGAVYKGLAIASAPDGDFLYAADFHNARVDVFDGEFHLVAGAPGAFTDPNLPMGYAPFGIQNVGGQIFVAYAKQDAEGEDEVAGPGFGYVDAYDTMGMLVGRIASAGDLNAPWGMAMAPADFGPLGGHLLIGNFGDGRINAYEAAPPHAAKGPLKDRRGMPITIDGLWGISFGNGGSSGPTNVLYFAAGPGDEAHGLFGSVSVGRSLY